MAQAGERTLLTAGIEHVRTLETRRVAVVKASIEAFLHIYMCEPGCACRPWRACSWPGI